MEALTQQLRWAAGKPDSTHNQPSAATVGTEQEVERGQQRTTGAFYCSLALISELAGGGVRQAKAAFTDTKHNMLTHTVQVNVFNFERFCFMVSCTFPA